MDESIEVILTGASNAFSCASGVSIYWVMQACRFDIEVERALGYPRSLTSQVH